MRVMRIEDALIEPVKLIRSGQVDMAADVLADGILKHGIAIKHHICHNGPEDLEPLFIYAGTKELAIAEMMAGFEDPGEAVSWTLGALCKELDGADPLIIGMRNEIIICRADPADFGLDTPEQMLEQRVGEASEALSCVMVHRYGDEYRVTSLTVKYSYGDGEVKFDLPGLAFDSVFRPESSQHEVGSDTIERILDFFKGVNDDEPADRDTGGAGGPDQVAEHHDSADGEESPPPGGPTA